MKIPWAMVKLYRAASAIWIRRPKYLYGPTELRNLVLTIFSLDYRSSAADAMGHEPT